ncbi:MAG: VTT domain-containing protein [bacterium]|nr:VTT domain-containing protein [bacterium]
MTKPKFKFQLGIAVAVLVSIFLYFWGRQIPEEVIKSFVENAGPWAPIAYILSHQISYVIAPISGFPFFVAGFYLFGKTVIVYSYFVAIIGASINFWIARRWGRPLVRKFAGEGALKKIDQLSKEYGIITLIALRMLQGGTGDFISYAYGLTPMKFSTYIITTALAMIPGTTLWYYVISKTDSIEQSLVVTLLFAFFSVSIFLIGNFGIKRIRRRYRKT